jgi:hypothetical protein
MGTANSGADLTTPLTPASERPEHLGGHLNPLPADDEIRSGRRRYVGFVHPPEGVDPLDAVCCPAGHHVPRPELAQFPEAGYYTCSFREPPGNGRPCNRSMLVLFVHRVAKDGTGRHIRKVFVAEIDWREFKFLESQGITDVFEMIAWLGEKYDPPKRSKAG